MSKRYIRRNRGGDVGFCPGDARGTMVTIRPDGSVMRSGCQLPAELAAEEEARQLVARLGSDPYAWPLKRLPGGGKHDYLVP